MSIDSFHASFQICRMVEELNWQHDMDGATARPADIYLKLSRNAQTQKIAARRSLPAETAQAQGLGGPAAAAIAFIAYQPADAVLFVGSGRRDRIAVKGLTSFHFPPPPWQRVQVHQRQQT